MKFFNLILITVLAGCATATKMMAPSGKQGYLIKCSSDISGCYEKAAESCPNGYKIANQDKSVSSYEGNLSTSNSMMIECK